LGRLPTPGGRAFGFAHTLAFFVDFAHEFAVPEHTDDIAPVFWTFPRLSYQGGL
jgi:hypothetical protein